jgi:tellurite methyltransferase
MNSYDAAKKWNERYLEEPGKYNAPVRNLLKEHSLLLPKQGWALEIAGGVGVSADYLQRTGLDILELDISLQALLHARKKNPNVFHLVADATYFPINKMTFDVICIFYFFERDMILNLKRRLNPGGLLFFETLTIDMLEIRPEIPVEFLLKPGELKDSFAEFEIIHYFEGWTNSDHGKRKSIGSLVARNPIISV